MEMEQYLKVSEFIDWQHPEIMECAKQIASGHETPTAIAKACFEWVRDEIRHSYDYQMSPVTYRASDVLQHKTGYCHYAKSQMRSRQAPRWHTYMQLKGSIND